MCIHIFIYLFTTGPPARGPAPRPAGPRFLQACDRGARRGDFGGGRRGNLASWVPGPPGKHTLQNCIRTCVLRNAGRRRRLTGLSGRDPWALRTACDAERDTEIGGTKLLFVFIVVFYCFLLHL